MQPADTPKNTAGRGWKEDRIIMKNQYDKSRPPHCGDGHTPDSNTATAQAYRRTAVFVRRVITLFALALLFSGGPATSADKISKEQMQSLDEQIQEVKSDVLGIASELSQLEEKLLYPSNTHVAVFVAIAEGDTMRLDSVRVQLDGELVAHHIYSFKELEALKKGGVQRIYTGNVATGDHQIEVSIAGASAGGSDFGETETFTFTKEIEPKLVGITLAAQGLGNASIEVGGW